MYMKKKETPIELRCEKKIIIIILHSHLDSNTHTHTYDTILYMHKKYTYINVRVYYCFVDVI